MKNRVLTKLYDFIKTVLLEGGGGDQKQYMTFVLLARFYNTKNMNILNLLI